MDKCTANSVNIGHLEGIQIAQLIVPSIGDQFARWTMCCFMHTDDITLFRYNMTIVPINAYSTTP